MQGIKSAKSEIANLALLIPCMEFCEKLSEIKLLLLMFAFLEQIKYFQCFQRPDQGNCNMSRLFLL